MSPRTLLFAIHSYCQRWDGITHPPTHRAIPLMFQCKRSQSSCLVMIRWTYIVLRLSTDATFSLNICQPLMYSTKDDDAGSQNVCVLKCMINTVSGCSSLLKWLLNKIFVHQSSGLTYYLQKQKLPSPCFILTWEKSHWSQLCNIK